MTPPEKETADSISDGLKLLFEYTKFHIGLYTSVIALVVFETIKVTGLTRGIASIGAVLLLFAAGFGGLIAGNIHRFGTVREFKDAKIGPFEREWITGKCCEHVEHLCFWVAAAILVFGHIFLR